MIKIQAQPFTLEQIYPPFNNSHPGALVSFVGSVRDVCQHGDVAALDIEHYPGMTEKALQQICDEAMVRWTLHTVDIIHRIGRIYANEHIVSVVVSADHRAEAFEAAQFIMDYLKLKAPFWKKEVAPDGTGQWVEQKTSDRSREQRWR